MTTTVSNTGLGDSITYGIGDPFGNSYRRRHRSNVMAARPDIVISDIGPNMNGDSPTDRFCATVGITVEGLQAIIPATFGPGLYQPQTMVVLIGANNAATQALTDAFMVDYPAMMTTLHGLLPSTGYMVSKLTPSTVARGDVPSLTRQTLIDQINDALPGIWTTLEGSGLILEPATPILKGPADFDPSEGATYIHPNPVGYAKLADTYTAPYLRLLARLGF